MFRRSEKLYTTIAIDNRYSFDPLGLLQHLVDMRCISGFYLPCMTVNVIVFGINCFKCSNLSNFATNAVF